MKVRVPHIFVDHKVNPSSEILILGTFNPKTEANDADFFYSRKNVRRPNSLWKLLPKAFGFDDMMQQSRESKISWMLKQKIDFTDLISEVEVEEDEEANYFDDYIDKNITKWNDVIGLLDNLPNIKAVFLTRKTVNSSISNMREKIFEIQDYCEKNNIRFELLKTPARGYSEKKQLEWDNKINLKQL
ncbi:hypothetical protein [Maribacter aestuarii]|uniref:hypothetical protein n=1 Tax=Maribacter aestuarii TaxID=1130723 RepID=UPI00248AC898|nr:hypothetical protein [Maribacter aestuarii]